jgi:hypothetical protein
MPQGDQPIRSDVVDDRRGRLRDGIAGDQVDAAGSICKSRRIGQGAGGRDHLELIPSLARQRSKQIGDRPSVEEKLPPVVGVLDPGPLVRRLQGACVQEPGVGLEPTASALQERCSTS